MSKPVCYNPEKAEARIRELEAENERISEYNRRLIEENASLQARIILLEADK